MPAVAPLTYEHYLQMPEDGNRHEIIDGNHYVTPSPSTRHQTVSRRIQFQLYEQIERAGKGEVFNAPVDLLLSEIDVVQPDLVVVLRQGAARVLPERIEGPPALVIEILSPSTSPRDRGIKQQLYRRAGVPEYWLVDPEARRVEQYLLEDGDYRLEARVEEVIVATTVPARVDLLQVW